MREAGIRRVHLMCHSMGTRVLLRSWPIIRALFRKSKIRVDSGALPAVSFEKSEVFLKNIKNFFLFSLGCCVG